MEYKIIQILNIPHDTLPSVMAYIPTSINSSDIQSINPFISNRGKLFKNVSVLETYSNKIYTVAENANHLTKRVSSNRIKGFIR